MRSGDLTCPLSPKLYEQIDTEADTVSGGHPAAPSNGPGGDDPKKSRELVHRKPGRSNQRQNGSIGQFFMV
jgi:hypothetical protein